MSVATRNRLFSKLSGNIRERQTNLFRKCSSLTLTFNNVQRGIALENQRGGQSSSYYKGTNQVAHEVIVFNDTSYDSQHMEMTYHDQVIPLPLGMPPFEQVGLDDTVLLLTGMLDLGSDVPPDFTGKTGFLIQLKNVSNM